MRRLSRYQIWHVASADSYDNLMITNNNTRLKDITRFQKGNQDVIWGNYTLNFKTLEKKNAVKSNLEIRYKGSGTISGNVC